MERRKILLYQDSNPNPSDVQPVTIPTAPFWFLTLTRTKSKEHKFGKIIKLIYCEHIAKL
jgi:negative regulator of replication initiation